MAVRYNVKEDEIMANRKPPTKGYYALRWAVLIRDNFTCQYCGQKAPNVKLEVDHVVSVEDGGYDTLENLKTSCWACNRGRSGLSIQLKRKGASAPYKPYIPLPIRKTRLDEVLELMKEKPLTANDIAQQLDIDIRYAHVLVNRLSKKKLINKEVLEIDNRYKVFVRPI